MSQRATPHLHRSLIIASRGSALALQQAGTVQALLQQAGLTAEITIFSTTGDRVQDRPLHEIGGKGLFIKELEQALLDGSADLAVHSLKDLPAVVREPFALAAVLPRGPAEDVLVLKKERALSLGIAGHARLKREDIAKLGPLRLGTGSLRRQALFAAASPVLQLHPLRGNVDTRLGKLRAGDYDGIVLAEAALRRLGEGKSENPYHDLALFTLDPAWCVPCGGQGALVIETLANSPLREWLGERFACADTSTCVAIERGVLAALGGDCTLPIGVHACMRPDGQNAPQQVQVRGVMADLAGREARQELTTELDACETVATIAQRFAAGLRAAGGEEILAALGKGEKP
jgi:hydroxymethylbilane synthase